MSENKNIWFVTNIPKSSIGGVARSVNTYSSYLEEKGYNVTIFFNKTSRQNYIYFSFSILLTYIKFFLRKRPQWIIARSTDAFFTLIFIRLFNLKTKVIIWNHGWEPLVYKLEQRLRKEDIDNPTTIKAKLFRFPMLATSAKLCNYLISGTINETRYLKEKFKKNRDKFIYLPNAIILTEISKKTTSNHTFITVANINWKKNLDHTISLFQELKKEKPDIKLICLGTGLTELEFKRRYGNIKDIQNLTSVDPNSIKDLYKTSDFLISSSRYEGGISFAILEAINYGVIIFSSAIDSSRELIKNNKNGLIISGTNIQRDLEIIKETISKDNTKIRDKAFNSIKKYSLDRLGQRLEKLLET